MTNHMRSLWLILLAACRLLAQAPTDRHVVVISLDGFPAYALRNPLMPLPALRRMIEQGAVADGMQTVNPTVTWPNHTSMVTGVTPAVHSVLYNGLAVRDGEGKPLHVEPWIDKAELVRAPTVYDLAHLARLCVPIDDDFVRALFDQGPRTLDGAHPAADAAHCSRREELDQLVIRSIADGGIEIDHLNLRKGGELRQHRQRSIPFERLLAALD